MASDNFSQALAYVERCATVADVPTLVDEFREHIRGYELTHSVCGAWTGLGQQRIHRFFFNDWPQDWLQLYNEKDFFSVDPFVEEARRAMTPFVWTEVEKSRPLTPRGKEVYEIGRSYGWREVIGIPIHGPVGYQAMVSLATKQTITLSPVDRACLDMMSRTLHDRCRRAVGFGIGEDVPKLTGRELECMQWVAVGKTDWEIAQVVGISSSTAHFHVESAKKKLGLSSRTEAVARLTLYGLI